MSKLVSIDAMSSSDTKLNAMEVISPSSSAALVGTAMMPKSVRCVAAQYRYSLLPPGGATTAVSPRELYVCVVVSQKVHEALAEQLEPWVVQDEQIQLNKIFDWYGADFVPKYGELHDVPGQSGKKQAALNFIAVHAPSLELAKTAKNPGVKVVYGTYDWSVNRR